MYDEADSPSGVPMELTAVNEKLLQRYQRNLKSAREEVVRLEKLTKLLENNPETAEILSLIGKGRG